VHRYATSTYMRKWMSERLKRRKKSGEGASKEASNAPEPLQPKYYDNEPAPPAEASGEAAVEAPAIEAKRRSKPVEEPAASGDAVSEPEARAVTEASSGVPEGRTAAVRPRSSRRRRGRGGRGGTRPRAIDASPAAGMADASGAGSAAPEAADASDAQARAPMTAGAAGTSGSSLPISKSKGTVILAIGLPGSGKSSWFKRHDIHPLSSDLLRELLFDDAQEQRFQDLVFSNLRSMLKARLIARRPMNYVDATNLTPHDRHSWIKLAKDYGYDVQGLFFDVPVEVCMERHQRRGRVVPEDIMRKMAGKLKAPTFDEGFSKITVVRVKQKEAAV
jgi:predicted kinase